MQSFIPPNPTRPTLHSLNISSSPLTSSHPLQLVTIPTFHTKLHPPPTSTPTANPNTPCPTTTLPTVVWLRNDLRLYDHPAFHEACLSGTVAPLYILSGAPSDFLLSCLVDLRRNLRCKGGDLFIRRVKMGGEREVGESIKHFCQEIGAGKVVFGYGVGKHERRVEQLVRRAVEAIGVSVKGFWTGGLFAVDELPFALVDLPEECDEFAERVRNVKVREPLEEPNFVRCVYGVECGELGGEHVGGGGERRGVEWVEEFVKGRLAVVGGGKVGMAFQRIAPYLKVGCVSARWIWWRVVKGESLKRYCAEWELLLGDFRRLWKIREGVLGDELRDYKEHSTFTHRRRAQLYV